MAQSHQTHPLHTQCTQMRSHLDMLCESQSTGSAYDSARWLRPTPQLQCSMALFRNTWARTCVKANTLDGLRNTSNTGSIRCQMASQRTQFRTLEERSKRSAMASTGRPCVNLPKNDHVDVLEGPKGDPGKYIEKWIVKMPCFGYAN